MMTTFATDIGISVYCLSSYLAHVFHVWRINESGGVKCDYLATWAYQLNISKSFNDMAPRL